MLTNHHKIVVKALIILTSIALTFIITALVLIIITKYYGFVGSSPISCSINYFDIKFTVQNFYLSYSFSSLIVAFIASVVLLVQFVILMVRMGRNRDANGNSLEDKLPTYYIIASLAQLGMTVTFGEYLSIISEPTKKCNYSIST